MSLFAQKKYFFFPFTINKYWGVAVSGYNYLVVHYDINSWNLILFNRL